MKGLGFDFQNLHNDGSQPPRLQCQKVCHLLASQGNEYMWFIDDYAIKIFMCINIDNLFKK